MALITFAAAAAAAAGKQPSAASASASARWLNRVANRVKLRYRARESVSRRRAGHGRMTFGRLEHHHVDPHLPRARGKPERGHELHSANAQAFDWLAGIDVHAGPE